MGAEPGTTVPDLVEGRAAERPDDVAVEAAGRSLTYAELDLRANRLARHLQTRGVGPDGVVAICLGRSVELAVSLLGVMKAGGACLPLDPAYPPERLAFLVGDAAPAAVIASSSVAAKLPAGPPVIRIDLDEPGWAGSPGTPPPRAIAPGHIAYVIYTSGSTGASKGVLLTHGGLVNHHLAFVEMLGLSPGDRVLQFCSLCFDISIEEMFPTWAAGATVVFRPDDAPLLGRAWVEWLRAERITVTHLPTGYWHEWVRDLQALGERVPPDLRLALIGGERALGPALRTWAALGGDRARWIDTYGPAEATCTTTTWEATFRPGADPGDPLIGRPLANVVVRVVDPDGAPVPPGGVGELLVGGVALARGYLHGPGLTADRFVPDPLADGARLYRTGDLVRLLPSGDLDFVGRSDDQVKIRGFRVEPAEVEAALVRHPGVAEAVVTAHPAGPDGAQHLVAHVVLADEPHEPGHPDRADDAVDAGDGAMAVDRAALAAERVTEWEQLYDRAQTEPSTDDPTLDTAGWVSSYTGDLIPPVEMATWAADTVARILRVRPSRVLELGCGTGLLLWRLAPRCASFVGVDLSGSTLARLAPRLRDAGLANVRLVQAEAVDLAAVGPDRFDTVVVNSVVEAFPDRAYLERVLAGAVAAVGSQGVVFVGDVRSLPLLGPFSASVELARAAPGASVAAVRERYERRLLQELELVVDPTFFAAWAASVPEVSCVEVLLKRGRHDNELSRFRYDVTIHVGPSEPVEVDRWLAWEGDGLDLDRLGELLAAAGDGDRGGFGVSGIPNARVAPHVAAFELLGRQRGDAAGPATAADLLAEAAQAAAGAVDPGALFAVGEERGWTVHCSWAGGGLDGRFDAAFLPSPDEARPVAFPAAAPDGSRLLTNDPLAGRIARRRRPLPAAALRGHLEATLPRHMVPSAFVILPALPLTANGKVDRRALPLPSRDAGQPAAGDRPATATEEALAAIWAEVLGLGPVAADDDFFELGGDSLLGAQVISRAREAFAVDVPLRAVFASVTIRDLALVVDQLRAARTPVAAPMGPAPRDRPLPLTFAQEGLWFLDQLVPGNAAYNVPGAYRLRGPLDAGALARAFDALVARHESLRTTFSSVDGRPVQVIGPAAGAGLEVHDLAHLGEAEAEAAAQRRAGSEAGRPFDLAAGPLLRTQLIRLGPDHHVLLVTTHHIVSDGWSAGVLVRDLAALYGAATRGGPAPLAPLPVQLADIAAWERQALADGPRLREQLSYWTGALAGAPLVLELPADRPRPPLPTFRGASHRFDVPPEVGRRVLALSRGHGTTPFTTLLAAFSVLLGRTAGVDDLLVGTPLASRDRAELEGVVGFLVNTVPLRADLSSDPSFDEIVARVGERTLGALEHKEVPLERIVAALDPERDLSRSPIVQVLFQVVTPDPNLPRRLGDAGLTDIGGITGGAYGLAGGGGTVAPFDLDLFMAPAPGGGYRGELVYATDLFDAATVAALAERFTELLAAVTREPERPLRPRGRVGGAASIARAPAPPERTTVPDLVEAQVTRTPDAVAVVAGGDHLTYGELDARANRLARHLQSLGVGPDVVAAVCLPRSPDLAVALLAVLKAGGACLPLDPTHPPDRLAFLVGDAAPAAIVTAAPLAARLPGDAPLVRVDADAAAWAGLASTAPPRAIGPGHAGYVIYTSGSTGEPKGVLMTHGGLVNHHRAAIDLYRLGGADRVLQFCSIGFDASIEELFPSWAAGATVVFRPEDAPLLGRDWLRWLRAQRVSVMNLPTGYWHEWARDIEALGERVPEGLRLLVVGGEPARGSALAAWDRLGGNRSRWVNAYGPTEATCMATTWEAVHRNADPRADPPIGRPLPNVEAEVVDREGRVVPPGVTGELLLGGAGLARGYLGRPDRTAESFVVVDGVRRYRTGDLVRQRPDGDLEYIGRADHQVKIRGFRVECGEVEAVVGDHPAVAAAVVVARRDGPGGESRLVAYVVPAAAGTSAASPGRTADRADEAELRAFVASRLPAYMVPSAFVTLGEVPLNANGKVDRDALPDPPPPLAAAAARRARAGPRTPTEERVAAIWGRVLGLPVEGIGVDDDFFALGGHSLLATQVVAQVREELGTATPLRTIFETPTVAAFASAVEAEMAVTGGGAVAALPPLAAGPRPPGAPVPLTLAQEQMWRLEVAADPPGLYNLTTWQRLDRPVDAAALGRALSVLVERHETLRTSIVAAGDGPAQVVHEGAAVDLAVTDLSPLPAAENDSALARLLAEQDARPFDLTRAPLFRTHLVHLDATTSRLVTTFDHLICDGTGAYVYLAELAEAYGAAAAGRDPALPPLELQLADFAQWQRRHVTGPRLERQVAWWLEALEGMPHGPAVPFDRVPATPSRRVASRPLTTEPGSRRLLQELATATGSTVFVAAAAAVQVVLGAHGSTSDVVLSTTTSGRGRTQLEGVIGMFSGIGRIRTDLAGDPSFRDVVERTRDFVLAMFDNQDVPFLQVRRRLLPDFPASGLARVAALPVELQYFRTAPAGRLPGAAVAEHRGDGRTDRGLYFRGQLHPLSITLLDDGAELWGEISYKPDFYEPATVERLARDIERLLAEAGRDPGRRLADLGVTASPPPR